MSLLDDFNSMNIDTINRFVEDRQEEHLQLDFKRLNKPDLKDKDDKENFAKAISGFANSMGGIIVWGIDCRKSKENQIDCVQGLLPIENIKLAHSRFHDLTSQVVSPTVDGVQHKIIEYSDNTGFIVTLIPESASGPHMAKSGEDRYYKRSGSSFMRMEHFEIQDMFGRRARPNLSINIRASKLNEHQFKIEFYILNNGRGAAKHTGCLIRFDNNLTDYSVSGEIRDVSHVNTGSKAFCYDSGTYVFLQNDIQTYIGEIAIGNPQLGLVANFNISLYCEHMKTKTLFFEVSRISETKFLWTTL